MGTILASENLNQEKGRRGKKIKSGRKLMRSYFSFRKTNVIFYRNAECAASPS